MTTISVIIPAKNEEKNIANVLRELPPVAKIDDEALRQAAELSNGSPGRALDLVSSKGAAAFAGFAAKPQLPQARCVEIGAHFAGRESAEDYKVFCELLIGWIGENPRSTSFVLPVEP